MNHYNPHAKTPPPKLRLTAEGPVVAGRVGFGRGMIAETIETTVGQAVKLTARVRRDNPFRDDDTRAIRVRWFKYQGPGDVRFTPNWDSWKETETGWVDSSTWADSEFDYGQTATEAVFNQTGEYIVQVQAYNDAGRSAYETADFEFWCCWTNAFVRVNVN